MSEEPKSEPPSPASLSPWQQAAIAAYSEIKTEIAERTKAQHLLIQVNAAVLAVVGAWALQGTDRPHALVVIPLVSSALGLLWLDHDTNIRNRWTFAQARLASRFANLGGENPFAFEDDTRLFGLSLRHRVPFALAVGVLFGVWPSWALAASMPLWTASQTDLKALWLLGAASTFLFAWGFVRFWSAVWAEDKQRRFVINPSGRF